MSGTAAALVRAMKGRNPEPEAIEGDFAQAVARRLEARGIARVAGLPVEQSEWFDVVIEHHRRQVEVTAAGEERQRAERQAEEAVQEAPQTTVSILISEIARAATGSGSATIPLNGTAVLRAALGGGGGTINGEPGD